MAIIGYAVITGVGVLLAGNAPWGMLFAPLYLRLVTRAPWAVVPMAAYLWLYWGYIGGRLGSPATAGGRRERLRSNPLASQAWPVAIITGLLGFGALLMLLHLMAGLMSMPLSAAIEQPPALPARESPW